jgi:hypothetical protein
MFQERQTTNSSETRSQFTNRYGVITRNTCLFVSTAVRTSFRCLVFRNVAVVNQRTRRYRETYFKRKSADACKFAAVAATVVQGR